MNKKSDSFEEKMMKLLETAEALEEGGIPLSEAVGLYGDAVSLIEGMSAELNEVCGKISIIRKKADGAFVEEAFDEF